MRHLRAALANSQNLLTMFHLRCEIALPCLQNWIMDLIRWRPTELANNKQSCSTDVVVRAADSRLSMHAGVSHPQKPFEFLALTLLCERVMLW